MRFHSGLIKDTSKLDVGVTRCPYYRLNVADDKAKGMESCKPDSIVVLN